ncbi:EamA family transporter [Peribacillus frigoritolerans]|nr:EamA family transporter [Peribacillus frigoritolerans]
MKIYILLTGIMITWGLNVSVIKILVAHTQPVTITSMRIFTASLIVIIILFFFGLIRLPEKKVNFFMFFGGALFECRFSSLFF